MASEYLQKARRIVLELTACIDIDRGGEIAKNMLSLYSYLLNELMEAAIGGKLESVDRSIRILTNLRSTWASTPSDEAAETVLPIAA
jgi:flagellar protein FliS